MFPSPDDAARVIIAACKACHVSASLFDIREKKSREEGDAIRQARAYAALALRKLYPQAPSDSIGRMVDAINPPHYLGELISMERRGRLKWFDPQVLARIVSDHRTPPVESPPAPKSSSVQSPAPRPAAYVREPLPGFQKRQRAEDILRQAVLNTGGRIE